MGDIRCQTCILSDSFPGIEFDEAGVCNFCRDEIIEKTTVESIEKSRLEAQELIASLKGKNEYDAIVCYSGGKDSTYTLKLAVERYGLRCLSFTLDNGFLSPFAFDNIHRVVEALGVDQVFFRPSKRLYADIIRTSLTQDLYARSTIRRISSGCQSCISMVNNIALKMAMEKSIPLILAGFTLGQVPTNSVSYKNDYEFLKDSRAKSLSLLQKSVGDGILPYLTIPDNTLARVRDYPYTVNLLAMENLSERQIIENIQSLGWVAPKDVDGCSSNCRLNVLNNYAHAKKYRFNPYELELSHLVRVGQLTRKEALSKIEDQSSEQLAAVMAELGMTEEQLG